MAILQHFYGRFVGGGSDKEYKLYLEEDPPGHYRVHALYGRTGACNATAHKYQGPKLGAALSAFEKTVNEKQGKGYIGQIIVNHGSTTQTVGVNQQTAPVVQSVTPIKQRSSHAPHLLTPIDEEQAAALRADNLHFMMQKFDGDRRAIEIRGGVAFGINRKGEYVTLPPELEGIADHLPFSEGLIDGELIGTKFYAFDLLQIGPNDLRSAGFDYRYDHLQAMYGKIVSGLMKEYFILGAVARTPQEKTYFHDVLVKANVEGEVFKLKTAPYVNGARIDTQYKFKFWKSATVMCGAVNAKSSFMMTVFDANDNAVLIGNCTVPPNKPMPKPGDLVEVRYLYAYPNGSLYQPTYLKIRDDVEEEAASVGQLIYKKGTTP